MTAILDSFESARTAQSDQSGFDVQAQLAQLRGPGSTLSPEAKQKKLREACEGFESIFIQKMWQEMRKSVHQSSFMHSRDEQFWQDMYDQELAKKMTSAGGIGLADMMYEQLSSHLTSASKTTASAAQPQRTFVPLQAPLLSDTLNTKKPLDLTPPVQPLYTTPTAMAGETREDTSSTDAPKTSSPERSDLFVAMAAPIADSVSNQSPQSSQQTAKPLFAPMQGQTPEAKASQSPQQTAKPLFAPMQGQTPEAKVSQSPQQTANSQPLFEPIQGQTLADVTYAAPHKRQQPVASGLEMANAARRQASDQLGNRGIREPLLPQTEKARNATMAAYNRREKAQHDRMQESQDSIGQTKTNVQAFPYSYPRTQAEMQEAASQFAPMAASQSTESFLATRPKTAPIQPMTPFESLNQTGIATQPSAFEPMQQMQSASRERRAGRRREKQERIQTLNLGEKKVVSQAQNQDMPFDQKVFQANLQPPMETEASEAAGAAERVSGRRSKQVDYSSSLFSVPPRGVEG